MGYFDATKREFGIRNAKINRVNEQKNRLPFANCLIECLQSTYLITFTSPPTPNLMMFDAGGLLRSSRREVQT